MNIVGTQVEDAIVPKDSADTYPTHYSRYGKGGVHTDVADLVARDAITADRREIGMRVYVLDAGGEEREYQLQGGILNSNWVDITGGSGLNKKETYLKTTAPAPAGTVFSLIASGAEFTKSGDNGNFGLLANFLGNKDILVRRNMLELRKVHEPQITYLTSTTFSLLVDLDVNETLSIITV